MQNLLTQEVAMLYKITHNLVAINPDFYIWLFLRSTALLLHAHKNTVFYRYNIIEAGKTVADV
jgi:hypothetical protein